MAAITLESLKLLGKVYCTLCTRTVDAEIRVQPVPRTRRAHLRVSPGQKCPRCSAFLDAAFVVESMGAVRMTAAELRSGQARVRDSVCASSR